MKKKIDWLTIIGLSLIFLSIILFAYYYFESQVNDCTSNPFRYGIEKVKSETNAQDVFGNVHIIDSDGNIFTREFFLEEKD